jgi:hypothetical protein
VAVKKCAADVSKAAVLSLFFLSFVFVSSPFRFSVRYCLRAEYCQSFFLPRFSFTLSLLLSPSHALVLTHTLSYSALVRIDARTDAEKGRRSVREWTIPRIIMGDAIMPMILLGLV